MKLLLDTHTFIWWDRDIERIPSATLNLIEQADQLLLSLVSLQEIQIKTQLGKFSLNMALGELVELHQSNGLTILGITLEHILDLDQLPLHHKDPFDRLLIAQSRIEAAPIVSQDAVFQQYDCQVCWKLLESS